MNARLADELKRQLLARGFNPDGAAPNDTMGLNDAYIASVELADRFDTMVARREKIIRAWGVVGAEATRNSYHDVVLAIEAIKAVLGRLALP